MNEFAPPGNPGIDDPVVLTTFPFVADAYVLRSRLEYEGIPCLIPEEHIASAASYATGMQVRILVNRADLETAKKIMADVEKPEPRKCPKCGSAEVESQRAAKNIFLVILSLFALVPLRRSAEKFRCRSCGHDWESR